MPITHEEWSDNSIRTCTSRAAQAMMSHICHAPIRTDPNYSTCPGKTYLQIYCNSTKRQTGTDRHNCAHSWRARTSRNICCTSKDGKELLGNNVCSHNSWKSEVQVCGDILQRFGCAEIFFIGSDVLRKKLQRFGCAEIAIRCAELAFFSFSTSAHLNHCFSTPELFLSTPDISAHLTYISAHLAYVSAHFPQHT